MEAECLQLSETLLRERKAARNQVRIQVERACAGDEVLEIIPKQRLSPGEIKLDNAERFRLAKDTKPCGRVEFILAESIVQRVCTVRASQRTPVGEFCDQRVWTILAIHHLIL